MLTNKHLSTELAELGEGALALARAVAAAEDLDGRRLAAGVVECVKLGQRLAKLRDRLGALPSAEGGRRAV